MALFTKGHAKKGGRPPGGVNKRTVALNEAILEAATLEGRGDLVAFLRKMARTQPAAFLTILGKLIPLQVKGDVNHQYVITRIERVIIDPDRPGHEEVIDAVTH